MAAITRFRSHLHVSSVPCPIRNEVGFTLTDVNPTPIEVLVVFIQGVVQYVGSTLGIDS